MKILLASERSNEVYSTTTAVTAAAAVEATDAWLGLNRWTCGSKSEKVLVWVWHVILILLLVTNFEVFVFMFIFHGDCWRRN